MIGTRTQHPVGQGFFHSAEINISDGTLFKYVVDCGALAKYEASRRKCISRYLKAQKGDPELDVLFITHFHADHVNGLIQLLDLKKGIKVNTIVMPHINVEDRLMCLAKTALEDRVSAESSFYEEFIVNPSSALSRFEPTRVLYVGGGEGGAPGEIGEPLDGPDGGDLLKIGRGGRLTSAPQRQTLSTGSSLGPEPGKYEVIPHTSAITVDGVATQWLLAPYVDPTVKSDRTKFLTALAKERKMTVANLKQWLEDSSNVKNLVLYGKADLVAAYNAVGTDLNVTSLCIYSGPTNPVKGLLYRAFSSTWHTRVGWLGTGDAALKSPTRRRDFLNHYRRLTGHVGTFTLPHHGSDHNFDEELIKKIRPHLCVAAADRYGNWRHPGSHTVQSVYSHGSALQVVTSSDSSQFREEIWRF